MSEQEDEGVRLAADERIVTKAWLNDTLDAAWAEAEAALPEGWMGPSIAQNWKGRWYAYAYQHHEDAPANPTITGHVDAEDQPTPAAALRALAEKLREMKR